MARGRCSSVGRRGLHFGGESQDNRHSTDTPECRRSRETKSWIKTIVLHVSSVIEHLAFHAILKTEETNVTSQPSYPETWYGVIAMSHADRGH